MPLHPKRCTIWCAVSAVGIVGPLFFGDTMTVKHTQVLGDNFILLHEGMGVQLEEMFFQQDGAEQHTANEILNLLHEHFGEHIISNCSC
jgi:hypothetical protein